MRNIRFPPHRGDPRTHTKTGQISRFYSMKEEIFGGFGGRRFSHPFEGLRPQIIYQQIPYGTHTLAKRRTDRGLLLGRTLDRACDGDLPLESIGRPPRPPPRARLPLGARNRGSLGSPHDCFHALGVGQQLQVGMLAALLGQLGPHTMGERSQRLGGRVGGCALRPRGLFPATTGYHRSVRGLCSRFELPGFVRHLPGCF